VKSYPTCSKVYTGNIIKGDGISKELFRRKPLLIIGDKPKCMIRNNFNDKFYRGIAEQFVYPTISMVQASTKCPEIMYGVGKFEIYGNIIENGLIMIDEIGVGTADIFSQDYAEFVSHNSEFATIYEMQERANSTIYVQHLHNSNDQDIRDIYKIPARASVSRIRKTIGGFAEGKKIDDLFDGIIINGNGIPLNVDDIANIFRSTNVPVRYIASSNICSIKSVNEQKSVIVAQEIFDRIRSQYLELNYTKKKRDKHEGKCRVISMITKPRS
jgi:hypothetical protein